MLRSLPSRSLLWLGIAAPVLFLGIALGLGAIRPGYDAIRQYVSLLSLGPGGWVQIANFVVSGILVAGFGVGLRRAWPVGAGSRWAPRLIVLAGAGLFLSGVFVTDPAQGYPAGAPAGLPMDASWHAGIHYLGALLVFAGLPAAMVVASRRLETPSGRIWRAYCLASALVMLGSWLATFAFPGTGGMPAIAGLLQRIAVAAGFQWLAVTAAIELARPALAAEPAFA